MFIYFFAFYYVHNYKMVCLFIYIEIPNFINSYGHTITWLQIICPACIATWLLSFFFTHDLLAFLCGALSILIVFHLSIWGNVLSIHCMFFHKIIVKWCGMGLPYYCWLKKTDVIFLFVLTLGVPSSFWSFSCFLHGFMSLEYWHDFFLAATLFFCHAVNTLATHT